MQCFRCDGLDFTIEIYAFFGYAIVKCDKCSQLFHVLDKLKLQPIELVGTVEQISQECIIINCNTCETKRYIADDCADMYSCSLCCGETTAVGDKIPFDKFFNLNE